MKTSLAWGFLLLFSLLFLLPVTLVRCRSSLIEQRNPGILVCLYLCASGRTLVLDLEDYLKGVVAAEMPANFHLEALKAQAVAARTVALRRMIRYGGTGSRRNPRADFSDDPAEGQAWLDWRTLRRKWGFFAFRANWHKICRAVEETRGMILTYQGRPIDAVFHSVSGPKTENARDVWGREVPYLQSVDCPFDRHSPRYRQVVCFSSREFSRLLGINLPSGVLSKALPVNAGRRGLQVIERSAGGRVKWIRAGGEVFRGEEFRRRLGLQSARFTVSERAGKIWIETVGYGHGVGLCQYGADGMAKAGYDFRSILHHYYTDVEIRRIVE